MSSPSSGVRGGLTSVQIDEMERTIHGGCEHQVLLNYIPILEKAKASLSENEGSEPLINRVTILIGECQGKTGPVTPESLKPHSNALSWMGGLSPQHLKVEGAGTPESLRASSIELRKALGLNE